jgi:acetyl-CoA decarbonylase/synthase complex subunit delta
MAVTISPQKYSGSVRPMVIGSGAKAFVVGGDTAYPFFTFEGKMPNAPRIGIQVPDCAPDDWAEACLEPYRDVLNDPVAWAKKAQDEYGADFIQLWLKSTDPNGLNRSAVDAAQTAKAVAGAIEVPLLVWGCANAAKDAEVLSKVAEVCAGKDLMIGPVCEDNHRQLGAQALAYNLTVVANSPIDINLAKQLNILLNNLGVPLDKIIIDPTTGGLGYGIEYTFSVMERIRQAALTQDDDKLQCPFMSNLADEVWKCKEAKLPSDAKMGDAATRGVLMEAITAVTLLNAGAELLVMRHPEAIRRVREYIAELGGFALPVKARAKAAPVKKETDAAPRTAAGIASGVMASLREGARCKIIQCVDTPSELAPGCAMALIKIIEEDEAAGDELVLMAAQTAATATAPVQEAVKVKKGAQKEAPKAAFQPAPTWSPLEDPTAGYSYSLEEKKDFAGRKVKLIQNNYESGQPEGKGDWRAKFKDKDEMIQQVKTELHYWYGEGYGSERRKKPA